MNGVLADEMGLGKTIQAIAYFAQLMQQQHNKCVPVSMCCSQFIPDILQLTATSRYCSCVQLHRNLQASQKSMQDPRALSIQPVLLVAASKAHTCGFAVVHVLHM
jgi:hypothetical protein